MAVGSRFSSYKNTTGGTFTVQRVGGVILGVESPSSTSPITRSLSIIDNMAVREGNTMTKERSGATYLVNAGKCLSGGTFAYNAARAGTWVISRITTTLSGVAKTNLLFMGQGTKVVAGTEMKHDFGVKMLTAWVSGRFSWTGKLNSGASKASRQMWLNSGGTAVSAPASLNTTFMRDIAAGTSTGTPNDNAAAVRNTRAIPGELVMMVDFVNKGTTGGNFFDYKPITGM